jgi:hypothetical protein
VSTIVDQAALRGKFYRPGESISDAIHLDDRVHQYLSDKALRKGVTLEELVNDLLKKTIELSWKLEG